MFEWRSRKYSKEKQFQDVIEQLLNDFHFDFVREKKFIRTRNRIDFEVNGSIHIECKICTKSSTFWIAIGQAFQSKMEKKEIWIVIPDDISVRKDPLELLQEYQIEVFNETGLREKLAGREVVRVKTKTTGVYGFCKCCTKENVLMSRSPSGETRSYCVDCEDEVKQRVFHSGQNRWVIQQTNSVN